MNSGEIWEIQNILENDWENENCCDANESIWNYHKCKDEHFLGWLNNPSMFLSIFTACYKVHTQRCNFASHFLCCHMSSVHPILLQFYFQKKNVFFNFFSIQICENIQPPVFVRLLFASIFSFMNHCFKW